MLAEELGAELRQLNVTAFVTHSSLSQEQRRQAEDAFANRDDCVIVATSVLELGINVLGTLEIAEQVPRQRRVTLMQNRRSFITTLVSTVLASRLAPVRAADLDPLSPIEKIRHDFVMRHMMDDDGLCRSFLCAATLAPWTNEDLAKTDQRRIIDMFQNSPEKAGCLSYENSITSWLVASWRLREAAKAWTACPCSGSST